MRLTQTVTFSTRNTSRIADIPESFQGPHACPATVPHTALSQEGSRGWLLGPYGGSACTVLLTQSSQSFKVTANCHPHLIDEDTEARLKQHAHGPATGTFLSH